MRLVAKPAVADPLNGVENHEAQAKEKVKDRGEDITQYFVHGDG